MTSIPALKTFRTPYGYYFFEPNKNQIVSTSQEVYDALNALDKSNDPAAMMASYPLSALRKMGYLSTFHPTAILHPFTALLEDILNRKLEKITLQLTQDCNLRCRYCAYSSEDTTKQRSHQRISMTWETAKKAIDFLYDHSCDSGAVTVGFYGGEPLMEFALLQRAVEYAEKKFHGKPLKFSMTTNGTILPDRIVEYLINHKVDTMISIDGPKEVHDANRVYAGSGKGSFDTIMENLRRIQERYPTFIERMTTYMVVDPNKDLDCYNRLFIDYDMLAKQSNNSTYVDTAFNDFAINPSADFVDKDSYGMFLAYLYHMNLVDARYVPPVALAGHRDISGKHLQMEPIDGLIDTMAPGGPCIPGALRMLVNVHEEFFPCERCNESSAAMKIGTLSDGFDIDRAKAILNIAKLNEDQCKHCWAILHCTCCAARITDGDSLSPEKMRLVCEGIKKQVEQKFYSVILLRELNKMTQEVEVAGA